jgi:hypothetical protein
MQKGVKMTTGPFWIGDADRLIRLLEGRPKPQAPRRVSTAAAPKRKGDNRGVSYKAYALFAVQVAGPFRATRAHVAAQLAWTLALRRGVALRALHQRTGVADRQSEPPATQRLADQLDELSAPETPHAPPSSCCLSPVATGLGDSAAEVATETEEGTLP